MPEYFKKGGDVYDMPPPCYEPSPGAAHPATNTLNNMLFKHTAFLVILGLVVWKTVFLMGYVKFEINLKLKS